MGRPTSSRNKKSSKRSSQARAKKKSKIRRSKKSDSKKLRRHYSSDDDGDSRSSISGSDYLSSSSEDTKHRSKKSRVRTRKRVVKKKRTSRHSYSSESSEDSPRPRKKSGSKRKKRDSDSKTKSSKKRRKRDDSVSSATIGSLSHSISIHEGDSVSNHEVDLDRLPKKRGNEGRGDRKRSRYRSKSPLRSERSESIEYQTKERVFVGNNNSRRLKSIIVRVTEKEKIDIETSMYEDREVLYVDDDHDYPSSRSNDTIDSGNKLEDQEKGIFVASDSRTETNITTGKSSNKDFADQRDEFEKIEKASEKPSQVSGAVVDANSDVEKALRLRALENLRKFRGVVTNQKAKNDGDAKESSISNVESVQKRLVASELDGISAFREVVSSETNLAKDTVFHPLNKVNRENVKKADGRKSLLIKQNIDCPTNQTTTIPVDPIEKGATSISTPKPKLVRPFLVQKLSGSIPTPKVASEVPEPQDELLDSNHFKDSLRKTASDITSTTIPNNVIDTNDARVSADSEPSLDEPRDETGESSQFEKKTMSVMRGGELVQVSYKVYIPKNAPALARRKLKR